MPRHVTATYRLQFTPAFGFRDALALVPYLESLGISHVYASPVLMPRSGSQHGYDVIDPTRLNPELGEEHDFAELVADLASRGMGMILDIVPNHMAASTDNLWWSDVLENGRASRFARYFDIDWSRIEAGREHQIVLPTLGDHIGRTLENGELRLAIDEHGLGIWYYEHRFPVDPGTYDLVLSVVMERLGDDDSGRDDLGRVLDTVMSLPTAYPDGEEERERWVSTVAGIRSQVWRLYHGRMSVRDAFGAAIEEINGEPGDPASFRNLERLVDRQPYRLAFWRRASEEINYRRFFDIADLVSLRVEDPEVFEAVHSLVFELAGTEGIDGVRADHVDGLLDPKGYAERLHDRVTESSGLHDEPLVLVEKILTGREPLPTDWKVSGTTGYEFAHRVNAVLTDPGGFDRIEQHYRELTGQAHGFQQVVHSTKAQVLDDLFAGEFQRLVSDLHTLVRKERHGRDVSRGQLATALRAVMILLPVYRTYVREHGIDERDRALIQETLDRAREGTAGIEGPVWDLLRDVFLASGESSNARERIAWIQRWQQFTGPLMAKGLEDTALYAYTPLLSLNEVGGEPGTIDVAQFHEHNAHIAANWPRTMLTTSTHDTKRSEDARARIGILSELSDEWIEHLDRWRGYNAPLRKDADGAAIPDANEEQFIYQTLLGAWPLDPAEFDGFRDRVKQYLTKAMREAKTHSSWIDVNEAHESAVLEFLDRILDQDPGAPFLREFTAFQTRISSYGAWNSLSQLVLKLTSPGFPDIYQGNELWNFSMADPDNRRPIDYKRRERYAQETARLAGNDVRPLLEQWRDGRIKMLVTRTLLNDRRTRPEPFLSGKYVPLEAVGQSSDHVIAFLRHTGDHWNLTLVPRHTTRLVPPETPPVGDEVWSDTSLILPDDAPSHWADSVTGERVTVQGGKVRVADVLRSLPVAVLRGE
jgi:(1->4)-alpha-D-glucan 1-alpha-D-glucosylmutase